MIDHRIRTFLALCDVMNYTKTAEKLNMTQPAVTQHIHYLEQLYGCRLFYQKGRSICKTPKGEQLERFARSMMHNDVNIKEIMSKEEVSNFCLNLGTTKTIGEYVIGAKVADYLKKSGRNIRLDVDNTKILLDLLDNGKIDMALVEGRFDKQKYDYRLMRREKFVFICARTHTYAGRRITLEQLFSQHVIVREKGSGTRDYFEQRLFESGYSFANMQATTEISNFAVICELVAKGIGVSCVYESVAKHYASRLSGFEIVDFDISGEFNYIFLKNSLMVDEFDRFINI